MVAKTEHFALHRNGLGASVAQAPADKKPGKALTAPALFPIQDVWIGAMAPKRWAKRAVTRNAIKRQIYTVSREFVSQFPQDAFVVRLRREFSRKEFLSANSDLLKDAVRAEVHRLMHAGLASK